VAYQTTGTQAALVLGAQGAPKGPPAVVSYQQSGLWPQGEAGGYRCWGGAGPKIGVTTQGKREGGGDQVRDGTAGPTLEIVYRDRLYLRVYVTHGRCW
jgi:hypothetical protein